MHATAPLSQDIKGGEGMQRADGAALCGPAGRERGAALAASRVPPELLRARGRAVAAAWGRRSADAGRTRRAGPHPRELAPVASMRALSPPCGLCRQRAARRGCSRDEHGGGGSGGGRMLAVKPSVLCEGLNFRMASAGHALRNSCACVCPSACCYGHTSSAWAASHAAGPHKWRSRSEGVPRAGPPSSAASRVARIWGPWRAGSTPGAEWRPWLCGV